MRPFFVAVLAGVFALAAAVADAMNVKEIKELVDLVARRGLSALEVERAGFRLRIEGARPEAAPFRAVPARGIVEVLPAGLGAEASLPPPLPAPEPPHRTAARGAAAEEEGLHVITSPIVGTTSGA